MGKKNRNEDEQTASRRGKRGNNPFSLFGTRFDSVDSDMVKQHIGILIVATIVMKFIIAGISNGISFVDYFDISVYLNSATPLLQGQIPYVNYQFEYPVLMFIPIILAFIPAVLTQNGMVFALSFQLLMVLCDIVIVLCVYFIGMKIYSEMTAFYAGLIYATAFSTAYFVITKSDAFPTALLMLGLLFTVYGRKTPGYGGASAGFFTKMFPAIALPFMVFYNAKKSTLKEEILSGGKIFLAFCIALLLPLAILNPATIRTYLFATGGAVGVYVNTATYTLYSYLHDVLPLGISAGTISTIMYGLMGLLLLLLVYMAYADREMSEKRLLKYVLCGIFCLVFFTKFHSPQYIVWFTPLLAILVADDLVKIGLFFFSQLLAYIEFPLMFGNWYTNLAYTNPVGTSGWYLTLGFFTLEAIVFIVLLYYTVRPEEGIMKRIKDNLPVSAGKSG
jgi:hypothetical protein